MKKLLVVVAFAAGILTSAGAGAQSVLPRAGWVTNASSSNGGDVPSHVLDGSAASRWTTGGNQTPGQWFTIDFGTAQTFTQVTMDVAGNTTDYARSYELYASNDGQTWGAPIASGIGATGIITIVFPAQTSRFIGIVQTGSSTTNWWSMAELNVYAGTVPTVPLTPNGWTATASVFGSSDQPSKAIDGNLASRFSTDAVQVSGQSFQLDMGSAQLIAGLKMDSGTNTTDYARGYQVFASNSTSSWGSAIATGTATASPITVLFPQTTARYLKIVQTASASNWWSIAELTMYTVGSFTPTASVLPRLGWSASASSTLSGNPASNVLDDSGSTRWATAVNQANGQSFTLDMQAQRSFTQVTLDAGSSNTSDYPRAYQLFVSNDGTSWGSAVATGTGSAQLTTISFSSQSARYVKVVQTGSSSTNKWSIAEANVYGVPPATLLRQGWTASAALDSGEAPLGIDGRAETQWSTDTAQVSGQTYQVDMKIAQTFNEITLDVNCNPADYPRGYQVFASNSTSNWGVAIASGTGTSSMIAVAFAPQTARYLKVVQTGTSTNYWGLAELNVLNTNPAVCSVPCVATDACHDAGTCNPSTGVCSNPAKANGTTCNDGKACTTGDTCQAGVCTGTAACAASDQCHVAGACDANGACTNPAKADGTTCSDGQACTAGDVCTAGTCAGVAVTCTALDACHVAGVCDPVSGACTNPAKADGTSCSDGNACNGAEACTAGTCVAGTPPVVDDNNPCTVDSCDPVAGVQHVAGNPGVVCRSAVGVCDAAEACTGTSTTCPADGLVAAGVVCRVSLGGCDVAESCTGTSAACPADALVPAGTTCRLSAGECDAPEACTGSSPTCPPDVFRILGTACSDDSNPCTTDLCPGTSATCQHSAGNAGAVCRPAAGMCDVAETCNGTTGTCPADAFAPPTTTCRPSVGACDVAEACTGSSAACPADAFAPSTTTCRASAGACDVAETCTGTAASCPSDVLAGAGTICRQASGQCDAAGLCSGASVACPSDAPKPNGTMCDDGNPATTSDQCTNGVCAGTGASTCPPPDQCRLAGHQDASGICVYPFKADNTVCNDGSAATIDDVCLSGLCKGSFPCQNDYTECDDGDPCTQDDSCYQGHCGGEPVDCGSTNGCGSYCDHATGACSTNPPPEGSQCNDGSVCTTGDTCTAGSCVGVPACGNGIALLAPSQSVFAQPSLLVTLTSQQQRVHPNETITVTGRVTYEGVEFVTSGEVDIVNNGASPFTIGGYSVTLEYQSALTNEWVALASTGFDANGVPRPQTTPDALTLQYSASYELGVVYPSSGLVGTVISSGATASIYMQASSTLPPAVLATLSDPTQAIALRGAFRLDPAPGLPDGGEVLSPFTFPVGGGDLTVSNVSGQINFDGTLFPVAPTSPSLLHPGDTATYQATATPPPATPASAFTTTGFDNGYQDYLQRLAQTLNVASSNVIVGGPGFGTGSYANNSRLTLPYSIPIVDANVVSATTNPLVVQNVQYLTESISGFPATWAMTVSNAGTETATDINIQGARLVFQGNSETAQPRQTTVTAPTSLMPGATAPGSIYYQSTAGVVEDVDMIAPTTWKDAIGNVYGPMWGTDWAVAFQAPVPLGLLSLGGQPSTPAPVTSVVPLAATAVLPNGQAAIGVNVQLTVTGANAQVLSAVTDASGVAHFSFQGLLSGEDSFVATATITTAAIQSNTTHVFWTAPYGTPCVGTDGPLDIVVAIDTSSSMEGVPLEDAKAATLAFLNTMDLTRDQLGVVSFGGFAGLNVGLTSDFPTASAGIESVEPGGGFINPTSIGAGLNAALDELASSRARSTATPMIVFISDGGNSFGDPEPALARLKASGIRTFAFGLGPDADTVMLNRIASSKSDYYYAPTTSELTWLYTNMAPNICRKQIPLVYAGGNQGAYGVRLPDALTLQGEIHDPGAPDDPRFTSTWSFVSGPGTVTFTDAASPTTTALFSDPGTYVLKLEATDGFFTGSDTATITVDSEPSLAGATLTASLSTPGPLVVGTPETLAMTLTDSGGHPISRFPVQVTTTGPNAQTATVLTDANGAATFGYSGANVGTDVLTAVALGMNQVSASPVSVAWTAVSTEQVVTQGWIGAPTHQSTVTGSVGITVSQGVTLTAGTVTYWPLSAPDQIHTLATGVSGGPGAVVATLDTTVLSNGPWVVKLDGTDDAGLSQISEASVTVSGDYKPGRVVVEETDMTLPLAGLPLTVGRRYDSLEKDNVGDFGHGWSLALGHPRLEVDPAHNVTITMPDNRRVTFYFQATSATASVTFAWLYSPGYVPEAGTFGTLSADGCSLMVPSAGQLVCFLDGSLEYAPTTYTYTDPYGRVFTMGASGELKSIVDRQQNALTFTPGGIVSSAGPDQSVMFVRDAQGRITSVTSPQVDPLNNHQVINYAYNPAGDLTTVTLTDNATEQFTYSTDHLLLTSKDPNGNPARTSTYDTAGHLLTDTDALRNVTSYAYDFDAHTTTITNPDTGTVVQTFDDRGLLLKEVDPLGRTTLHTYDANRNELTRTNAVGEVTTFTYDVNGNQTSIRNDRGETTHVTYNDFSQQLTSTDPTGHTTTTGYDELGIPTTFSDELGTLATFTSSEHGLPLTVTDAFGNTAYLTYDAFGNVSSRTDRLGRITSNLYDGLGRLTQVTDPRGTGTQYGYSLRGPRVATTDLAGVFGHRGFSTDYDANLNIADESSSDGRFTAYAYDALNHVTKVTHGDSTTIQYTRDFRGNPLTMKDESARTTTYEYDKAGQLKKTTFPDGTFTTRAYDDLGRLATATDERGNATTYEYEAGCGCTERVTKVTDPLARATVTTYDAVGRRASVTDAAGNATSYSYDGRGHLTKTTYADATAETDDYDLLGRRTKHTDQMGSVTQYEYDAEGQLMSVTDALSNLTHYGYDLSGNLTSVVDASNHTTTYVFDHLNRKSQRTLPLGMSETWAYNMYGDNLTHVDFRGKTTTMTYDGLARLLTKVPDNTLGEPTVTFTYNATGTRASMVDASGTTTYGYDARDRLLTKAAPAGMLTYTYDPAGNVATIRSSNANGTSVDYAWDAANQLVSVTDNRAGGVTTSAYTSTGRQSTLSQPSGVGATYSYDARDRVTSLAWKRGSSPAFGSWAYEFNGRGQRASVTDASGRHVAYGYDAVSRLVSETISGDAAGSNNNGELSYSLDPTGNRLTRTSTLTALDAQTFAYDANDQLTSDGNDANGNTTSSGGQTFAYDFENRLVAKDGGAVAIVYDGDGNRVAKTVKGLTTNYLVDDLNPTGYLQVLEEVANGNIQTAYVYGTMVVSQRRVAAGEAMSYYGYDAHGNVTFLADATGDVTDTFDYDAWGLLVASTGATPNTRLYLGEEFDFDFGLINLRARQYSPARGRFLTLDTMQGDRSSPISYNRYLYTHVDPLNTKDPLGLAEGAEGGEDEAAEAPLTKTIQSKTYFDMEPRPSFYSRSKNKGLILALLAQKCKDLPVYATIADKILCWFIVGASAFL